MTDPTIPETKLNLHLFSWQTLRWLFFGAVVIVAGAVVDLLHVRSDIASGKEQLESIDLAQLEEQGVDGVISSASAKLERAHSRARSSPFLKLLSPMPFVGDQVRGIRNLTAAAAELGQEAQHSGEVIAAAIDEVEDDRLTTIDLVAAELDRVEQLATAIDLGEARRLLPPLRSVHRDATDALTEIPERFDEVRTQLQAVRKLLEGPTTFLVQAGNNAEMRAGTAMPLQIGAATFEAGEIEVGPFISTTDYVHDPDLSGEYNSQIPEELTETYPNWRLGDSFAETAVLPDFSQAGPLYHDIAAQGIGLESDGVIHIDAMALAEILDVTGPIVIDGVEYTSETAPQLVLNQTYIEWDGVSRRFRRHAQSELATEMFATIEGGDVDILAVAGALKRAAEGRHLMAWARDPALQGLFEDVGMTGDVTPVDALVSLQNTAANKLDWYIDMKVDVEATPADADHWLVVVRTTVIHPERELTVAYIEGPRESLRGGVHRALLTVQVPPLAEGLIMPGEEVTEMGYDGTSSVIGTRFTIQRGEERVVTAQFLLPRESPGFKVLPSARVRPVEWVVNGRSYDDDTPFTAFFGPFPIESSRDWQGLSLAGVFLGMAGVVVLTRGALRTGPGRAKRAMLVDDVTGAGLIALSLIFATAGALLAV